MKDSPTANPLVAVLRALQLDTCDRAADEIVRLQRELDAGCGCSKWEFCPDKPNCRRTNSNELRGKAINLLQDARHGINQQLLSDFVLALVHAVEIMDELGRWKADAPPELLQRSYTALAKLGLRP